jgi:hypothetical protein
MAVGVIESRQKAPASQIDDCIPRGDPFTSLLGSAYEGYFISIHCHGLAFSVIRIHRQDVSIKKDNLRGFLHGVTSLSKALEIFTQGPDLLAV